MNDASLEKRTVGATKWSLFTQVASKLVSPITQLVLAHLLVPEAFGVVSLTTMVTSFADMFSDAGFQKYLIQHEFRDKLSFSISANVAFWTNLALSFILWGSIILLRDEIAILLGDPTIGAAIGFACASLPLTSAISVQTAVYQREFDFKVLFYSRIGSAVLVFLVSVPLAVLGFGYWSMIAGTVASNGLLAIWLTARSEWKPSFIYSVDALKSMFSFSSWTLVEAASVWLTNWMGTFVLGSMMSTHYLGLYNTSTSLVNSVTGIVTSAVNPVIFASLSRVQNNRDRFARMFYQMQKSLGFVVIPIAICLFVFRNVIVNLYLGKAWIESATLFGLYALSSAFVIVFGHTASNAYRALGLPRLSLYAQLGFMAIQIPSLVYGASLGFGCLSIIVPVSRVLGSVATHFLICAYFVKLSPAKMLFNLRWVYAATLAVAAPASVFVGIFINSVLLQIILFILCAVAYCVLLLVIRDLRMTLKWLLERFGLLSHLPLRVAGILRTGTEEE